MASLVEPRKRRLECGLTQGELADRAGVSRQLVAAVEGGRHKPSVDAALGLARALATTVEELFASPPVPVRSAFGNRLRDGAPLRVARLGDELVAAELPEHGLAGTGWASPDGVWRDGRLELLAGAEPAGLSVAGCEPGLGIAEQMLSGLGERSLLVLPAATGTALAALGEGRIHAAVVHGGRGRLPRPPVPVLRLHFARWQVGLGVTRSRRLGSLESLLASRASIVQREPAAAVQQAFESARAAAGAAGPRPGPIVDGHLVAARLAAALGAAAVTTEAAAGAFGLRFLAIEEHEVELWIDRRWVDLPASRALRELLAAGAFTDRLGPYGGYDLRGCGTVVGRSRPGAG